MARKALFHAGTAVDADAVDPFPVYRDHGGLDDRGTRPPAMADLRPHAYHRRRLTARLGWKRAVYLARFHGHVHAPRNSFLVLGRSGNRTGSNRQCSADGIR